jgi:hypothetical protein
VISLTLIASEGLASADPAITGIDQSVLDYQLRASELDWSDREAVIEYQIGAWRLLAGSSRPFDPKLIRTLAASDLERSRNPLHDSGPRQPRISLRSTALLGSATLCA